MIWVYTVTELNELHAREIDSLEEIKKLDKKVNWYWIDFMDPIEKEKEIFNELIKDAFVIKDIEEKRIPPRPKKVKNLFLFSFAQVIYKDKINSLPIYTLLNNSIFITLRNKESLKIIKNVLETFKECVGRVCSGPINSSFILGRLSHEISNEYLDAVMSLRENIDKIEEKVLENPKDKMISRSVFSMKRQISAFQKILWSQRELMLSIREGIIPMIAISDEVKANLEHPTNNISRELSLLDSYNNALDSILSLQDLGMIHRVERNLINLTIMALIVSILLIILEIDIISLLTS
jgi:Mg2+ and Co2+ transporter CorA